MHRFYLPPDQCHGSVLTLTAREAHHGLHVLRLQAGERVGVLDGAGHEYLCEVRDLARDTVKVSVIQKDTAPPLPYKITLLQAVTKSRSFDTIVQKATELGVNHLVPLLSDRVVAHLDDEKAETKLEKWRLIAIEAIKQCGSPWLPQIDAPVSPRAFLEGGDKFELSLIASLQPDGRHPREWFKRFYEERQRLPQSAAIWIGPEGDYTPAELNAIKAAGPLPITLGKLVLRSETAAIYCLSILNYELQSKYP